MRRGQRRGRVPALVGLIILLTFAPADGRTSMGSAQRPGTVETVVGPGFCADWGFLDDGSTAVGALAVSEDGTLFFRTGPANENAIARVTSDGEASLVRAGNARFAPAEERRGARVTDEGDPFSLANAPAGGVFFSNGTTIVHLERGETLVAGDADPTAPGGQRDAGTGTGDGGPALNARFSRIRRMAGDEHGNLYVADELGTTSQNVAIRFLNLRSDPVTFYRGTPDEIVVAPGHVDTVAGVIGAANAGDGGPARRAVVAGAPAGLAVAGDRLYLGLSTDTGTSAPEGLIRVVNLGGEPLRAHGKDVPAGAIETISGGVVAGDQATDRPVLSVLRGIAADRDGNLFAADERRHRVLKIDAGGTITTFAGSRSGLADEGGFNGNGRPAVGARLSRPHDVKVAGGGRVYISDDGNSQVRFVDATGTIHAAPGRNVGMRWWCRASAGASTLTPPVAGAASSIATVDDDHRLYVANLSTRQVIEVLRAQTTEVVAGRQSTMACLTECPDGKGDGGPADQADLHTPVAVAATPQVLYVLDAGQSRLRVVNRGRRRLRVHGVTVAPKTIATIADHEVAGRTAQTGPGSHIPRSDPTDLASAPDGGLFVADAGRRRVERIDGSGAVTTVARPSADEKSCCGFPVALTIDAAGNLYIADVGATSAAAGGRVWFVNRTRRSQTAHGETVPPAAMRAVAGTGTSGVGGDGGPAVSAQFRRITAMAVDHAGNLYLADGGDHTVRKVDARGVITTVVGTGQPGFNGDGLRGNLTRLMSPTALAVDGCGDLLIAEGGGRVRRLKTQASCYATPGAATGGTGTGRIPPRLGGFLTLGTILLASALLRRRWRRARAKRVTS